MLDSLKLMSTASVAADTACTGLCGTVQCMSHPQCNSSSALDRSFRGNDCCVLAMLKGTARRTFVTASAARSGHSYAAPMERVCVFISLCHIALAQMHSCTLITLSDCFQPPAAHLLVGIRFGHALPAQISHLAPHLVVDLFHLFDMLVYGAVGGAPCKAWLCALSPLQLHSLVHVSRVQMLLLD